jgi:hypothetical protein
MLLDQKRMGGEKTEEANPATAELKVGEGHWVFREQRGPLLADLV